MKKLGRRTTFLTIIGSSTVFSFLAAYSIQEEAFYLFCFSLLLLGMTIATLNQFRFAAMESVTPEKIPKAASTVLLGGIAAAFIGPEVALAGKSLSQIDYWGSFILLSGLFALGFISMLFYKNSNHKEASHEDGGRSLITIVRQPIFLVAALSATVGYAVMSFIMTATPVSMHVMDGHSLEDTKWVIQSHIMAMFLPSFISPFIIAKLGNIKVIIVGLAAFAICIVIAFSGHQVGHYWWSLLLLGMGWNFLFIGGTTLLPSSYIGNEKFKVQALNDFIIFGAQAVAALSAGFIVHALGWKTMLLTSTPFLFLPIIAIYFYKRSAKKL
jgi:MFS family permease